MHERNSASRREAALAAENDELREEIRQLRELLTPPVQLPTSWKLTPQQARIVVGLARGQGQAFTTEHLLGVMYGPGHEHGRECLHVAIMKIRRKRDLHGLTTENRYGGLHSMQPKSFAAVHAAIRAATLEQMRGGMRGEAPIGVMAAA